jgi:3-oxoadipate enol-lactonase
MWDEQSALLASKGYRVVRLDTRGHGASDAPKPPYAMSDLVADTIDVMNALDIDKAHYVGLSLGGMTGFGLALHHAKRFHQFILCDARADAPHAFSAPWDERIAIAKEQGCAALAQTTIERWFGKDFAASQSTKANKLMNIAACTSVDGFVGCAKAIQGLDYLKQISNISTRTTLVVGSNDGPLPQAMADIAQQISGGALEIIQGGGHLPNIDQKDQFNLVLLNALTSFY